LFNALSVDVEDYFQVSAFEREISRDCWDQLPQRVEANTEKLLALFDQHGAKATFFVLGWVAQRHPRLVRRIGELGHELASHGFSHTRVCFQSRLEFSRDVNDAKMLLEDISGQTVKGYRAPTYSITAETAWAFDVLEETGYQYSSSIYPIRHDLYGIPDAPRFPFRPTQGNLIEIPISTVRLLGRSVPCGGGGYFRLFPYWLSRWAIRSVNVTEHSPCVFYLHPWEIDPEQPRQTDIALKTRFRHYVNLARMESRLRCLLQDFSWDRIDKVFLARATEYDTHAITATPLSTGLMSRAFP
jgi:polysaccharide deacetylase family protein (PEP-CTERM system associated)